MKIKSFKIFESEELKNSLEELDRSLKQLKSYAQYQNRTRLVNKDNPGDVSEDFKIYFYDLIDDGWELIGDWDPKVDSSYSFKESTQKRWY